METGRESALTHALRLWAAFACLGIVLILAAGSAGPLAATPRAGTSLDPARLQVTLVAAVVLVAAGLVMVVARVGRRLGLLSLATGACLALATTSGDPFQAPAVVIGAALAAVPLAVLGAALMVRLAAEAGGRRLVPRGVVPVMLVAGGLLTLAHLVVYDPLFEPACVQGCERGTPLVRIGPAGHLWLNRSQNLVIAIVAVVTLLAAARWLLTTSRRPIAVTVGIAGAAAFELSLLLHAARPAGIGGDPAAPGPPAWLADGLAAAGSLALAAGIAAWARDTLRMRIRMQRAAADVAAATGDRSVESALVEAFGIGPVEVTFPLPDGRGIVDRDGMPSRADTQPAAGRTTTPVLRDGSPIALIHHPATVDAARVTRELTPSMLLALDIERLAAVGLANLRLLRESRARIVAVQDAERRRVERDLHDGAQQRILAVAMELRLARTRADPGTGAARDDRLQVAEAIAFDVLDQLRRLARGVHPAILSQGGLGPALSSLAEEAPIPMTLDLDRGARLPQLVEAVAYRAVAETLGAALRAGATELAVAVRPAGDEVHLDIELDGAEPRLDERLADRVGAAGGHVALEEAGPGRHRIRAVMPCA